MKRLKSKAAKAQCTLGPTCSKSFPKCSICLEAFSIPEVRLFLCFQGPEKLLRSLERCRPLMSIALPGRGAQRVGMEDITSTCYSGLRGMSNVQLLGATADSAGQSGYLVRREQCQHQPRNSQTDSGDVEEDSVPLQ